MKARITFDNARLDALVLAIIALMVRFVSVWKVGEASISEDSQEYLVLAKNLIFHNVFSLNQGSVNLGPSAQRPPLYPAVIAALWWGEAPPVTAILVLHAVVGAATVVLVYSIARQQFGRTTAIVAGVGMAFARMTCIYTASILTETLFTFLVTVGVFFWGRKRSVWAGLAFGLAGLTRTTILPFFLLLLLLPLLRTWRRQWRVYITIAVVAIAVCSIWVTRNAVVFGRFIPVQESGFGLNLLFGTIEVDTFSGRIWNGREWTMDQSAHPLMSVGTDLNGLERERVRLRLAVSRIVDDPRHWLSVRARQYPRLIMDDNAIYKDDPPLLILRRLMFHLCNFIILILAVFGVFVERARVAALSHLTLFPAFLLIIHLPLWIETRYSLPMMPMVAILAAVGFMHFIQSLRMNVLGKQTFTGKWGAGKIKSPALLGSHEHTHRPPNIVT